MYDIKKLLSSMEIKPSKKLSQNFLIDENVINSEVSFANLCREDIVLDIGAGFGFLTEKLSEKARKVVAVELDKRLASYLKTRFEKSVNIEIVQGDILDLVQKIDFDKVVANIPYEISSQITFALLEKNFKLAIVCYQKEFAERMVAKPGTKEYSRLSVMTNYFADAEIMMAVSKESFYPQPKVDSAIVSLKPRKEKPYNLNDEQFFFKIVALLFQHKKQTVRNALVHSSKILKLNKKELRSVKLSGLESRRVFTLEGEEMAEISKVLGKNAQGY
ncbi:MAG: ribosomal RNA small subunit methyltransferase A [Candidatus Aenigmarchaeota archaeon]|nr:ribosomal RNA small subunit methyltransferase A [Candidatus Aenigmarchaeota archaeon]